MWTRRCPKATLSVPHKAPSTNDIFGSVELLTKFRSKKSKKNVFMIVDKEDNELV